LAGQKKGAACPTSGRLIDDVVRIAKHHKPKFVVLENVPNIITIANGSFWEYVVSSFNEIGYDINYRIISPVDVGIPQNRKRVFVVANRKDIKVNDDIWPSVNNKNTVNLKDFLDNSLEHKKLEPKKLNQINTWQNLIQNCSLPSRGAFSIVAPEFGANYPEDFSSLSLEEMKQFKGAYGQALNDCKNWEEIMQRMPSYTQKAKKAANWIKPSIQVSREIYLNNQNFINQWIPSIDKKNNSWQILEWRGKLNYFDLFDHLIQFRASGIRVLKPEIAPSLIAMTPTQIPIVPSEARYLSKHEAAKLQFLHELKHIPENTTKAFKAFGNAVNARIVNLIATELYSYIH
jgi:DNA (cytosine-5)-methyltransferase 1